MTKTAFDTPQEVPFCEGMLTKNVLRRVKPDDTEVFYGLSDNLEEAISDARELWEWSYSKSTIYIQRWHKDREHPFPWWELKLEG